MNSNRTYGVPFAIDFGSVMGLLSLPPAVGISGTFDVTTSTAGSLLLTAHLVGEDLSVQTSFSVGIGSKLEVTATAAPRGDLVTAFGPARLVFTGIAGDFQLSVVAPFVEGNQTFSVTGGATLDADLRHRGEVSDDLSHEMH